MFSLEKARETRDVTTVRALKMPMSCVECSLVEEDSYCSFPRRVWHQSAVMVIPQESLRHTDCSDGSSTGESGTQSAGMVTPQESLAHRLQ